METETDVCIECNLIPLALPNCKLQPLSTIITLRRLNASEYSLLPHIQMSAHESVNGMLFIIGLEYLRTVD